MKKQFELSQELSELNPIVGKWTTIGSFKNNPNKHVEGWENYTVKNKGSVLFCDWETITVSSDDKDVYKNTMNVVYDKEQAKILGDNEWILSFRNGVLSIKNKNMRFTGEINKSEDTISGTWEVQDKIGNWNYWYDLVLTKVL